MLVARVLSILFCGTPLHGSVRGVAAGAAAMLLFMRVNSKYKPKGE
jgi:hypothetical protein